MRKFTCSNREVGFDHATTSETVVEFRRFKTGAMDLTLRKKRIRKALRDEERVWPS